MSAVDNTAAVSDFDFDDLDRYSELLEAATHWEYGNAEPIAAFVVKWGAQSDGERQHIARMLTTRPDARKTVKPHTKLMLREVESLLRHRAYVNGPVIAHIHKWVARLRLRLAARGLSPTAIELLLKKRRPGWLRPYPVTLADIDADVAKRYNVTADAVTKLRQRKR